MIEDLDKRGFDGKGYLTEEDGQKLNELIDTAVPREAILNIEKRGTDNDANSIDDGVTYCTQSIPTGFSYAFVFQVSFAESSKVQLALPFSGAANNTLRLAWRWWNKDGGWANWQTDIPTTDFESIASKGNSNDANNIKDGITWCRTNKPSWMSHAYVLQCSYNDTQKVQLALPYEGAATSGPIAWRWYHTSVGWTSWVKPLYFNADGTTCTLTKLNFLANAYLTGYSNGQFGWAANHVNIALIGGTGGTPIQAGTYTTVSTRASKTAIEDLTLEQARKLLELNPIEYEVKGDEEHKKHYGMIAEDVDEIDSVPVTRNDGEIVGLDYQSFVAPLIKLAQEQERRITELEGKIKTLEARGIANVDKT